MYSWDVWACESWKPVEFPDSHSMQILTIISWVAMASFLFFAVFTVLDNSDLPALLMILSLFVWVGCGIAYIRIKRSRRKMIKVI